jgi:alpha-beta hydrolase superfamily lysophospholipase
MEAGMGVEALAAAHQEDIRGATGMKLHIRSWRAAQPGRAAVMIVPGFNSHSGYYEGVAAALTARALDVFALDLRGRGQSDGERFFIDTFDDYVSDVAALAATVKARAAGKPVFLLGHSAGGVVACLYALEHQAELAGLVCESFAFRVPAPDFALAALKGLSHIAPHAHVLHLKNEDFSRDPQIVARMNADPLIAHETQPTKTVAEMVRADERLEQAFPQVRLPLLILHGTADRATRPEGSQMFFDQAGSPDKTLKLYEGAFHDPLNDLDRATVIGDVVAWLEARLP